MNGRSWLLLGAGAVAFGTAKLLAQLFLLTWEIGSDTEPDIAARGVWLLGMFLPGLAVAGAFTSVAVVLVVSWRATDPLIQRLGWSLFGGVAGGLLIVFGVDPTALILRLVPWPSPRAFFLGSSATAALIIAAGILLIFQSSRTRRSARAAA